MPFSRIRLTSSPLRPFLPCWTRPTSARATFGTSHPIREPGPFTQFDVRDKIMIITGGARGLGLEIADQLYDAGAHVYCLDRLQKPAPEFAAARQRTSQLGGSLLYKSVDITDARAVNDTVDSIATRHGQIDGLVANAGITLTSDALQHTEADVDKILRCNIWGTFLCATAVGRQMLEKKTVGGSIVLVASMSGLIANKGIFTSIYNTSKAGVIQLGRNLAQEWGPVNQDGRGGIRVNSLCPGHIATPMAEKAMRDNPGAREVWGSENMLGRIARPHEFRGAALFLLSGASSYMTGSTLVVDGGHTAW